MTVIELQQRIKQATAFASQGNIEQAISAFEDIVADHSNFEPCYSVLCDLYLKAGKTNLPDEWIKKAIKFDPSFNETFLTLASKLQSQGNIQESIRVLTALVDANPDNYQARQIMGNILSNSQNLSVTALNTNSDVGTQSDFPECLARGDFLPLMLSFDVCNRCNASCMMCDGKQRMIGIPPKRLTIEELNRKLEDVNYIKSATLSGSPGEPFLNKDIMEIIRLLKSKKAQVFIISNGSLLSKPVIEELIDVKLDILRISVHGARRETAEAIMRNVNFETVISSIKQIKQLKETLSSKFPRVDIMFVGMKRNITELSEVVSLAGKTGIAAVHLKSLLGHQRNTLKELLKGESLTEHPELLRREFERAKATAQKFGVWLGANDPYNRIITNTNDADCEECKPATVKSVIPGKTRYCLFPFSQPYLTMGGMLSLCCSDAGRHIRMGDVNESSLGSVWDSDAYVILRKALLTGENLSPYCDKCERAPMVDPIVMQLDIAARQVQLMNKRESQMFIKKNIQRESEYVKGLEKIGMVPIKLNQ